MIDSAIVKQSVKRAWDNADTTAAVAGGALASLPAVSLGQDYAKYRTHRKSIEDLASNKFMTRNKLIRSMKPGDFGMTGGVYDPGTVKVLQMGAEATTGIPLGHGFIVGPGRATYHGGSAKTKLTDFPKNVITGLKLEPASASAKFKAVAESLNYKHKGPAKMHEVYQKILRNERIFEALQQKYLKSPKILDKLISKMSTNPVRGEKDKMVALYRSKEPLSTSRLKAITKQLRLETPAQYDALGGSMSGIGHVLFPRIRGIAAAGQRACSLDPSKRHHCGSLPGKALQAGGLIDKKIDARNILPGEIATHPGMELVAVGGRNPRMLKSRLLEHASKNMGRRGLAGAAATLGMAGLGIGGAKAVQQLSGGDQ